MQALLPIVPIAIEINRQHSSGRLYAGGSKQRGNQPGMHQGTLARSGFAFQEY